MATPKRLSAFAVGAVLLSGCHGGSSSPPDRLAPPADTGTVSIDMNGRWLVTEVEVLEQRAHDGTQGEAPPNSGMHPLAVGTVVTIENRRFTEADTWPLVRDAFDGDFTEVYTYLNSTDGRFGFYDLGSRTRPDPRIADGGSSRAQLVVGSTGENTMLGLSAFEIQTAPFPRNQPYQGLYRVRLERQ